RDRRGVRHRAVWDGACRPRPLPVAADHLSAVALCRGAGAGRPAARSRLPATCGRLSMERRARHIREFVEALAGPAVYLVFFGLIYVAASLVCALSGGNDPIVSEPAAVIGGAILGL